MTRSARLWLEDILEAAELLRRYVSGIDFDGFKDDVEKQDAVVRRLEIIGQAVKELPEDLRAQYPSIQWRDIAGAREVVAHEYFRVDLVLVWGMVTKDVPKLAEGVRKMLRDC